MAVTDFRPYPGNYGEEYVILGDMVGSNLLFTSATANSTYCALPANGSVQGELMYWKHSCFTVLANTVSAGTGTMTLKVQKRRADGVFITLSNAAALAFGNQQFVQVKCTPLAGLNDNDRTFREGDLLVVVADNTGGTISTAPTRVGSAHKMAVLK